MHLRHMPTVNMKYWLAITLASLFGTNMGDFYAHETHLGIVAGLAVLAVLAAAAFLAERRDTRTHALWYWAVIIVIRTGATNIADFLAYEARIPDLPLGVGLGLLVAVFGWASLRRAAAAEQRAEKQGMPATGVAYWAAMLSAGVFGTAVGDMGEHAWGEGFASVYLAILLVVTLLVWRGAVSARIWFYWVAVAVARTAGTAMGDYLAESDRLNIGLPLATTMTGCAFVLALLLTGAAGRRPAPVPA